MKRCTRTMLLFAALLLLPCAAFAVPENAAPADAAPAMEAMPSGPEGAPFPDVSPVPPKRLTLAERLMLQDAVCVLWHNAMKQAPAPVESLDLQNADAPEHIFISPSAGYYFEDGVWIFEGLIRQMSPRPDGIEAIGGVQYFNVHFKPQENGGFFPAAIQFTDVAGF